MRTLIFLISSILFASPAIFADSISVTLDTSGLVANSNGPYTLDFQFVEGNGIGDSNNTVTLSDFIGGVIATPPSSSTGGISVTNVPLSITITDSSFFNDVQFGFTPGATLTFDASYTTNDDAVAPDTFTFAIFDGSGNEISTDNPNGFNSFLEVDLPSSGNGTGTVITASAGTDPNQPVPEPIVVPLGSSPPPAVPEPSTFLLIAVAIPVLLAARRRISSSSKSG